MVSSKATSVTEYLKELTPERRRTISAIRKLVKERLPKGYSEGMYYGMITWHIPLRDYPDTYNGQPLCIASLASQKNNCTLYLMGAYADPANLATLEKGFRAAGKKLDMGKSCVHFRTPDDLALDAIGDVIASVPPERLIEVNERAHPRKSKTRKRG